MSSTQLLGNNLSVLIAGRKACTLLYVFLDTVPEIISLVFLFGDFLTKLDISFAPKRHFSSVTHFDQILN